jgi:hypothetical protein
MQHRHLSSDRIADALVAALLLDALREVAAAYARANKTAALFTIATIERDLMARAEAFPDQIASPSVGRETADRILARIASAIGDVQRAAEDITVQ